MKPLINKEAIATSVSNTLDMSGIDIRQGDSLTVLKTLLDASVNCVVTSPPYFHQRDYGTAEWEGGSPDCKHVKKMARNDGGRVNTNGFNGSKAEDSHKGYMNYTGICPDCGAKRIDSQLGLEETPDEFVANMVTLFREVRRVLKDDGTCWINIGDSYVTSPPGNKTINDVDGNYKRKTERQIGHDEDIDRIWAKPKNKLYKHKDMYMVPFRLALALWEDGWYVRQDIIWAKANPTPESAKDRCTKSHEYIFLLTKQPNYYFDYVAIKEKGVIPAGSKGGKGSVERGSQEGVNSFPPKYYEYDGTRQKRSVWHVQTHPFTGWSETYHLVHVASGEVCGGNLRRVFPGCPVHGSLYRFHSKAVCDGCEAYDLIRKFYNGSRHVQAQNDDFSTIDQNHVLETRAQSLDSLAHKCFLFAIDHNKQNRKKDHVPLTNFPCTSFFENFYHTVDKQELFLTNGHISHIHGSNISLDDLGVHPLEQNFYHIVNKSSLPVPPNCICSHYQIKTDKSSHFATFPPKLITPCVLAGCPVDGVVLDPFMGSGTVGMVCRKHGRKFVGIELNPSYIEIAKKRIIGGY